MAEFELSTCRKDPGPRNGDHHASMARSITRDERLRGEEFDPVAAKGKAEPLPAYRLVTVSDGIPPGRSDPGILHSSTIPSDATHTTLVS